MNLNHTIIKLVDIAARVCLAAVFVIAVPVKITKFSSVIKAISARGIPEPLSVILLVAAIGLIVVGSLLLVFGRKQRLGASLLLIFLVPTTIVFHVVPFHTTAVFMNLGLIGGLTLALTRPELVKESR